MKVFKFGGASVRDASSLANVASILQRYQQDELMVVVSAMGKTTNALEQLNIAWCEQSPLAGNLLAEIKDFHLAIIHHLDISQDGQSRIASKALRIIEDLNDLILASPFPSFNQNYDQVVSYGELISTTVVSAYLLEKGIANTWLDARDLIVTSENWRDARIQWEQTSKKVQRLKRNSCYITQGFIGREPTSRLTTTLGREGSDFSASILAWCLHAEEVTIWKDVPGVLSADPRIFSDATLIPTLSYEEAIELTYFGASVIHPKTVKPLQNKGIPLYVRSFINPEADGTCIGPVDNKLAYPTCIILKRNQVLLAFKTKDYAFIAEENLQTIFGQMASNGLRAHLTQNSALSFIICTDNDTYKLSPFLDQVSKEFEIEIQENLELVNLRHYTEEILAKIKANRQVIVEQSVGDTIQFVLQPR